MDTATRLALSLDIRPLLRGSSVTAGTSADAEVLASGVIGPHRLTVDGPSFSSRCSVVSVGATSLALLSYSGGFRGEFSQPLEDYFLVVPLSGSFVLSTSERSSLVMKPGAVVVLNPTEVVLRKESLAPMSELLIRIPGSALERRLRSLAPKLGAGGVEFGGRTEYGLVMHSVLALTIDSLRWTRNAPLTAGVSTALESHLVDALLLSQSHDRRSELYRNVDARISLHEAILCAAEDMVDALDEPIDLERTARSIGLSQRQFRAGFRQLMGCAPTVYQRNARLDRAHERLAVSEPGDVTVADIAYGLGFTHLGRFAAAYQQRFGCLPSETLRHRRGRARMADERQATSVS